MYILATRLTPLPVISLQTGLAVALTKQPLINPLALELTGLVCQLTKRHEIRVVMARDVREFALDCLIVDTEDELADPEDIVRLEGTWERPYQLLGKPVVSDMGRMLGKIDDYTINSDSYRVQKIYVRQSILRSLFGTSLIIDRTQIIDVTPQRVIVRDSAVLESKIAAQTAGTPVE